MDGLLSGGGGFERTHRKVRALPDVDFARVGMALDPVARRRARAIWLARMQDERRAVVAMTQLVADLARAGAPLDVVGAGARVVHDEARHVELCARVASALDPAHAVRAPMPEMVINRVPDLRVRVAKSVVSLLCVGETLSMALLRVARAEAEDPAIAEVLEHLLADESIHSRFGWWWAETWDWDAPEADAVAAMLPRLFARLDEGLRPTPHHAVWRRTVSGTIVPRLRQRGIAVSLAWDEEVRSCA